MPAATGSRRQSAPGSRGQWEQPRQQGLLDSHHSFGQPKTPAASLRRPFPDCLAQAATAGAHNSNSNNKGVFGPPCGPNLPKNSMGTADPLRSTGIDLDDILPPAGGHQATAVLNTVQAYEMAMLNTADMQGSNQGPHRVTSHGGWDSLQRTVPLPEPALNG